MSLASLFFAVSVPLGVIVVGILSAAAVDWGRVLYAATVAGIVWIAHADNIGRLLNGTERKFDFAMLRGKPYSER